MPDTTISAYHTLHDYTEGNQAFTGNVHIQSADNSDFYYGNPSQSELDTGNIKFSQSKNGYAMIAVLNAGVGMVALKTVKDPITVRIWSDSVSAIKSVQVKPQQKALNKSSGDGKNLSIILWVSVIIALLYALNKNKK